MGLRETNRSETSRDRFGIRKRGRRGCGGRGESWLKPYRGDNKREATLSM